MLKSSENGRRRGFARVRQVAVTSGTGQTKSLPLCFICSGSNSRHFIGDCELFKSFSNECKKRSIIDAGRCLNCLALGHVACNCSFPSKCRKCGPTAGNKHATVLHESYGKTISVDVKAAEAEPENENRSQGDAEGDGQSERDRVTVRKLIPAINNVLLRTSAVRVINPRTGKSTLVYAQHDTASQVTLIFKRLKDELNLEVNSDSGVTIRTLAEQTTNGEGLTQFTIQSLTNNEKFDIEKALIVQEFTDEESTLPHSVDVTRLYGAPL